MKTYEFQGDPVPLTRRTFMKTSALTVGGAVLLARGIALGTSTSSEDSWEYILKCTHDPRAETAPGFGATDLGAFGNFGFYSQRIGIDPNGLGDNARVVVGLAAVGPSRGQLAGSFTVELTVHALWKNKWVNPLTGSTTDRSEGPVAAKSSCTVYLGSANSPTVNIVPNPQIPDKEQQGNLQAHALVTPAFNAYGMAVYHDDGYGSVRISKGPFTYDTDSEDAAYCQGPKQLSWGITLMRRRRGSGGNWDAAPTQPIWNNQSTPVPAG